MLIKIILKQVKEVLDLPKILENINWKEALVLIALMFWIIMPDPIPVIDDLLAVYISAKIIQGNLNL